MPNKNLPAFFEAGGWEDALRAGCCCNPKWGRILFLSQETNAYQRLDELTAINATLVLSLDYPKAYNVSDPYTVSVHWVE